MPLEVFQACQGVLEHNPSTTHLKVYGCRAYPLVYNIGKLEKLEPRTEIKYLLGYNSTNIFRIWVPERYRIVWIRDVTFDESQKYHPDDLQVALANRIEDRIEFIEFLDTENLDGGVNNEWEIRLVDSNISLTIEVIPRDNSDSNILNAQKDSSTDSRQIRDSQNLAYPHRDWRPRHLNLCPHHQAQRRLRRQMRQIRQTCQMRQLRHNAASLDKKSSVIPKTRAILSKKVEPDSQNSEIRYTLPI